MISFREPICHHGLSGVLLRPVAARRRRDIEARADFGEAVSGKPEVNRQATHQCFSDHERTVGKQLAALGFRRFPVRPQHPKSDPEAQEAIKKTSPRR